MRPTLVVHADWGSHPSKRWMARARLRQDGTYVVEATEPVGRPEDLLDRARAEAGPGGCALVGFDFPIGLPAAWAARAGVRLFLDLLPRLGLGKWSRFYEVAARPEEIGLRRPFYPARPGGTSQRHLVEGLGVHGIDELRRRCERARTGRRAAAPLFWTLGGQQVGKGAIVGWRDVLAPALRRGSATIWPFCGPLAEGLRPDGVVVVETYPTEYCVDLGVRFMPPRPGARSGKRVREERVRNAGALLAFARRSRLRLSRGAREEIERGFGAGRDGEDRFDAAVGLLGMLDVIAAGRPPGNPPGAPVGTAEGWILGLRP